MVTQKRVNLSAKTLSNDKHFSLSQIETAGEIGFICQ
jgi:hypothetical protein